MTTIVVLALLASQTPTPPTHATPPPQRLDFSEVHVTGELARPTGSAIYGKPKVKFRNMIEMRANFRPELQKSADH